MWGILKIVFVCVLCKTHTLGNNLKASLEIFNLTYVNKEFIELNATVVAVSKNVKKIRGNCLFKYGVTDNLQMHIEVYRITKNDKKYLIFRGDRPVRTLMHLAENDLTTDSFRSHCIPDFYWPIKPNVTYTLRDWWLTHSECPFKIATGRFNLLVTTKYPNTTIFDIIDVVVNIFNSAEKLD